MNQTVNEPRVATVSQLNNYIKKIFDKNLILNNIWIKGEISNYKRHYSGHLYITLKDESSVLKAVMFKSAAAGLEFEPQDGMKIIARGRVSCYESGGVYQLYIEEMVQDGIGRLYALFEKLKKQLAEEGLFDQRYKKPIPRFPKTVGVITAPTGAAVRDIINVITRRFPQCEIILYPAQVQGTGAAESVVAGIRYFNEHKLADTLIVGRGGGSIEDLWAFNEEITARAIFESEIPVISAVGHETDFTIADFVSDLRAPTPSAAAELAVPSRIELNGIVNTMNGRMIKSMMNRIDYEKFRLKKAVPRSPMEKIGECGLKLDNLVKRAVNAYTVDIMEKKTNLSEIAGKLDALSPLAVLSRGYAIPKNADGHILGTKNEILNEESFMLKVSDGEVECKTVK